MSEAGEEKVAARTTHTRDVRRSYKGRHQGGLARGGQPGQEAGERVHVVPQGVAVRRVGAGLAEGFLADRLVESHGGSIRGESDGPNLGALLTIDLPTAVMPPVRPSRFPPAAELAPERAELRILLVEDHAETRVVMVKLLRKLGHDVMAATYAKEALALARDRAIDLVVSDIGLPDGSGHDVMRALCGQAEIKCLAVSGYGTDEDVQASLDAGFFRQGVRILNRRAPVVAPLGHTGLYGFIFVAIRRPTAIVVCPRRRGGIQRSVTRDLPLSGPCNVIGV